MSSLAQIKKNLHSKMFNLFLG